MNPPFARLRAAPEAEIGAAPLKPEGLPREFLADSAQQLKMPDDLSVLSDRIQHLFSLAFSDTAVREACVGLEHRIKVALDRERWGDSLVNRLLPRLRASGMLAESHLRILRGEIRTVVKSTRNDFTPNFIDIDGIQGRALLHRIARVQVELDRVL